MTNEHGASCAASGAATDQGADPAATAQVIRTGRAGPTANPDSTAVAGGVGPAGSAASDPSAAPSRRRLIIHCVVAVVLMAGVVVLWLTRPAMLDTDEVSRTIGERIGKQVGEAVQVHCPDTARSEVGETFRCTATTSSGGSRTVVVTVTDDKGGYTWRTGG